MTASSTRTWAAGVVMLAVGAAGGFAASRWFASGAHAPGADAAAPPSAGAAAAASAQRRVLYWYDPMVPTQRFDKPGKSPFMDMQLVPRYAEEDAAAPALVVSPQALQSLGVRTALAERRAVAPSVDVPGFVMLDERDVAIVQARAAGFVERVPARAPGDLIDAGAPVAELQHPEWIAAQHEFLAVRATADAALAAAARQRLVLLGMPAEIIERVERGGQPVPGVTVSAPASGVVVELGVRPGMTVAPGQTLVRINGLATVWVEALVPEALAGPLRPGQAAQVRLPATPGDALRGRVAAVLPEANRDSRTLRVRIELPNPGLRLRPGMSAQVAIAADAPRQQVVVPAEAVIRTGRRALVYVVDAPGRFRPVEVETGAEVDERIVIVRGIEAGQAVVASGQFLIDSEASLRGITARAASGARP